jgi:hypothetical protein
MINTPNPTTPPYSAEYPPIEQHGQSQRLVPTLYIALGVGAVLVIAVLLVLLMVWLAGNYAAEIETVRDLFLIGLGLTSCLTGIVMIMLLVMVIRLVKMLEFEIKPILIKTNETLGTLRGTTTFVSRNVVGPVTTASSYMAGIRRGIATLFGDPRRNLDR